MIKNSFQDIDFILVVSFMKITFKFVVILLLILFQTS